MCEGWEVSQAKLMALHVSGNVCEGKQRGALLALFTVLQGVSARGSAASILQWDAAAENVFDGPLVEWVHDGG